MEKIYKRSKKVHRHPMVIWSRLKLRWPFLVWLAAIVLLVVMFSRVDRYRNLMGMVEVIRDEFATLEDARLSQLHVVSGQPVKPGDLLAEFDHSALDAEMEVERLQIERQFTREVQRLDSELRGLRLLQAEADSELQVLEDELKQMDALLAKRLIDAPSLSGLKARREALRTSVKLYPEIIASIEKQREEAQHRSDQTLEWMTGDIETTPLPSDDPRSRLLSLINVQRDNYIMRARRKGIISQVLFDPGEIVPGGQPVLTMVCTEPVRIVGFLPEASVHDVQVGMSAMLQPMRRNVESYSARVVTMGPEVMALPGRVSTVPGRTDRGVRVVLEPNSAVDMIPGETVRIRIVQPGEDWLTDLLERLPKKVTP